MLKSNATPNSPYSLASASLLYRFGAIMNLRSPRLMIIRHRFQRNDSTDSTSPIIPSLTTRRGCYKRPPLFFKGRTTGGVSNRLHYFHSRRGREGRGDEFGRG